MSPSNSSSSSSVFSRSSRSSRSPSSSDHSLSPKLPYRNVVPPATAQTTFLFIDSQADNPQNQALKKEKQAFLLKNYNRRKRQAAIERLKPSKPAPSGRLHLENTPANAPSTKQINSTGEEDQEYQQSSDTFDDLAGHAVTRSEMWSLKAYLSQGYKDPFSSYAVEMSDSMNLYFHHFRIHTIAACYPLDATRMSQWWWQKAITQPALLQALLFLTAGHQATLESTSGISSRVVRKSMRDSLHLRGDTLKTLNNIMQDPVRAVAESTTLVVASLVAIEAVDANFVALEAHQRGLIRLINLMGGLDTLDHMTLSKIYQSDVKSAALNNARPIFPILPRWRSEILQDSRVFQITEGIESNAPKALSTMGLSIFNSTWFNALDSSMQTFLRISARLIIYYETAMATPSVVMPTDNDLFLVLEHQLLSACYANPEEDLKYSEIHLDEPLRLTLLIYLNLRIWHFQTFPFMQFMVEALKQTLTDTTALLPHLNATTPDLLFWIIFIGGLASQGYPCHSWFVGQLIKTTRCMGLEDWDQARGVLSGFFYTDQRSEKRAEEALWSEVLVKEACKNIPPVPVYFGW
ncbi:hypothetical protein BDV12DRAFT_209104 [Aspergillus spectabilis]